VAPVFEESAETRELYLPEGGWYHYESEEFFEGGREVEVEAPLRSIPLFVKAGAIIPKRPYGRLPILTGDNKELILDIYGGNSGTFRLYEDDGETMGYQSGEFSTIAYRYFEGDDYLTFNIGAQVNQFPERRDQTEYTIRFKFVDKPAQITANGEIISDDEAWIYDAGQRQLLLKWTQNDKVRTEFRVEF
jgi:alpha-glucosidase (family GH31 glycosyl hydrolase)